MMRFKYENSFYKLTFDGTILKYSKKRLLRWLTLSPFKRRPIEFSAREISSKKVEKPFYIFNTFLLELAIWNPVKEKMQRVILPKVYLFSWHQKALKDLCKIISHETALNKKQQTWFLPRNYDRMVG